LPKEPKPPVEAGSKPARNARHVVILSRAGGGRNGVEGEGSGIRIAATNRPPVGAGSKPARSASPPRNAPHPVILSRAGCGTNGVEGEGPGIRKAATNAPVGAGSKPARNARHVVILSRARGGRNGVEGEGPATGKTAINQSVRISVFCGQTRGGEWRNPRKIRANPRPNQLHGISENQRLSVGE
jgi:hypothetical protein